MPYIMLSNFSNTEFQEYDGIVRFQYKVIGCIDGHKKERGKPANMVKNLRCYNGDFAHPC